MAELIGFDKNKNLFYGGFCKLSINHLASILFIEPKNEEHKLISALFKWKYAMLKNILFVFAENDFMSFCLTFRDEETCTKVFKNIPPQNRVSGADDYSTVNGFLIPIFNKIAQNPTSNQELIQVIAKWFGYFDDENKEIYKKLMKECNVYDLIEAEIEKESSDLITIETRQSLKRKVTESCHSNVVKGKAEVVSEDENERHGTNKSNKTWPIFSNIVAVKKSTPPKLPKIIKSPDFELHSNLRGISNKRLIVFHPTDRTQFYPYVFHRTQFFCDHCRKKHHYVIAKVHRRINGEKYLITNGKNHICNPQTIQTKTKIPKSMFILCENTIGEREKKIMVFTNDQKEFTYDYSFLINNYFTCRGCTEKKRYGVSAKIGQEKNGEKFVLLNSKQHICEPRKFDPKMLEPKRILPASMFQLSNNSLGEKDKWLIIYASDAKQLYRKYACQGNYFKCIACASKCISVTAKLKENEKGDQYLELNHTQHICSGERVKPLITDESRFELAENTIGEENRKLILYTSETKKFAYIYYNHERNQYICTACAMLKTYVRANLLEDKNEGKYLELNATPHACCPKEIKEKPKVTIVPESMFQFQKGKFGGKKENLIVFTSEKQEYGYIYFCSHETSYQCLKCLYLKHKVTAKLRIDKKNGKKFLELSENQHCCPLRKFCNGKFQETIDCKIVPASLFELHENKFGEKDKKLIIFTSDAKDVQYHYGWCKKASCFECPTCHTLKKWVTAKLHENKAGEKYVELGPVPHACTPPTLIPESMFEFGYNKSGTNQRLILFTSESKKFCYNYFWDKKNSHFACLKCNIMKIRISVKLIQRQTGEKFIQIVSETLHACEPEKYVPEIIYTEKVEPQIIPSSMFELHPNTKGEEDKTLVIFTAETKKFAYCFHWHKGLYYCSKCYGMKKYDVRARLAEDKKSVEFNGIKHICAAPKYNPTKVVKEMAKPQILPESLYELHKNSKGEENRRLIVFTSESKEFCYSYCWDRNKFQCSKCERLKHYRVTAKFCGTSIEISGFDHACSPVKFDRAEIERKTAAPKTVPESMFKLGKNAKGEENKKLTLFISDKKNLAYIYSRGNGKAFCCQKCQYKKLHVSLLLKENENGTKYAELGPNQHVCAPTKL